MRVSRRSRVLVGTPTFEYHRHCLGEFIAALRAQSDTQFDLMLVDNSPTEQYVDELRALGLPAFRAPFHPLMRRRTAQARNMIREVVLRGDYTHLLFLDQDVILPVDGLSRLLMLQLPVVSGVYCKVIDGDPYAFVVLPGWENRASAARVTPLARIVGRGVIEIEAAGFGCLLVERDACAEIPFRYRNDVGADLVFCEDLRAAGWRIFCDTDLVCEHRYVVRDFEQNPSWGTW
jgi:hypothetical protein